MDYRGWTVEQLSPDLWRGVKKGKHGSQSVQEGSQRALEARIDAIAGPAVAYDEVSTPEATRREFEKVLAWQRRGER